MRGENNNNILDFDRLRIGSGFDVHPFADGRDLWLGGIHIPDSRGLAGHSDADVLTHAVIDAILGAASMGDIGTLFPDTDEEYKDISSIYLLERVWGKCLFKGIKLINIDITVACESPKIMPHSANMKKAISSALGHVDIGRISIKATTTEKLGAIGREEGIAAHAVVLLYR